MPSAVELLGRDDLLQLAPYLVRTEQAWPLNQFDALLVAQTDSGRPMTTHHMLEIDGAISLDGWARALAQLVREYPELGSRIVTGLRTRRVVSLPPRAGLLDRLIHDRDGSHAAVERWLSEPIDLTSELPIRVRVSPGQVAEQAVCLSLHHSVCDGVGALALLHRLTGLAAGTAVGPRRSQPFADYGDLPMPSLPTLLAKLRSLRRPAAQLIDRAGRWASGQQLVLRTIGPQLWASLGHHARAAGVTRTTALWHAVETVAGRQRLDDEALPLRVIAGVDLRAQLGVPNDALGNWLGTLEHELSPTTRIDPPDPTAWSQLHVELRRARQPDAASITPSLLASVIAKLPIPLVRAMLRRVDSDLWPAPFSLMIAPLRIPAGRCWPTSLQPRRLWCASTLPRRPGIGLTFTEVAGQVFVAGTCQAAVLRRSTLERLVDELLVELQSRAG